MARLRDGRVDVELVNDVVGLVPPALGGGALRVDELGEHAVVHVVEVVGALLGSHRDLGQPLDHPGDRVGVGVRVGVWVGVGVRVRVRVLSTHSR